MGRHRRGSIAGAIAGLAVVACGPSRERTEAEATFRAIELVRDTAPDERTEALAALERLEVRSAESVAVRTTCLDAFRPQQRARDLMREIGDAVDGGVASPAHAALLGEAQGLLAESEDKMPACERAILELRTLHRL